MNSKEAALVRRSEKRRGFTEDCYAKTKQGRFEKSITTGLVYPDGRQMEVSDCGRAVERMVRSLDWPYHQARREGCVRELAARLKDSTLQRILWGVFRGRNQVENDPVEVKARPLNPQAPKGSPFRAKRVAPFLKRVNPLGPFGATL